MSGEDPWMINRYKRCLHTVFPEQFFCEDHCIQGRSHPNLPICLSFNAALTAEVLKETPLIPSYPCNFIGERGKERMLNIKVQRTYSFYGTPLTCYISSNVGAKLHSIGFLVQTWELQNWCSFKKKYQNQTVHCVDRRWNIYGMSFLLAFDQLRNHSICIKISAYHVHRFHLNNSGLGSLEHVQWGVWAKNSRHEVAVKKNAVWALWAGTKHWGHLSKSHRSNQVGLKQLSWNHHIQLKVNAWHIVWKHFLDLASLFEGLFIFGISLYEGGHRKIIGFMGFCHTADPKS